MKKAILVIMLTFSVKAQMYRIVNSNYTPRIYCYVVVQSSGCVPKDTILYPKGTRNALPSNTFTNGVFCFRNYVHVLKVETNLVVVGKTTITNVEHSNRTVLDFLVGDRVLKRNGDNLFVSDSDFVKIATTNVPDETAILRHNQQMKETLEHNAKVASGEEKIKGFLATTNTATLSELQAKGVDIRFREILSVDYTANGRPIIRRRWVMCSEAFGEPLGDFY